MFVQNRILLSCCFALVAAVAVSGCGGGDGGGPAMRGLLHSPEVQAVAPRAEEAAEGAAGNAPSAGSVTQSSNGDGSGITTDTVSVADEMSRNAEGAFEFTVAKTVGSGGGVAWDVDQRNGRQVVTNEDDSFEGFELEKRVGTEGSETGTVYVDFYTDIEEVSGPGTSVTVMIDDSVTVDQEEFDRDFTGTLDSQSGRFSCSGSTCSLQRSVNPDTGVGVVTEVTGWTFTPYGTPDTDWLAGGVWLYIPDEGSGTELEIGAFGDGRDPFIGVVADLSGTAVYRGEATGIYASFLQGQTEVGEVGYFDADATLTARFGEVGAQASDDVTGVLSGFSLYTPDGEVDLGGDIALGEAGLSDYATAGLFTGTVTEEPSALEGGGYDISIADGGNWGGQFFGNDNGVDGNDHPSSVGGTFGATGTSTFAEETSDISLVGTFGANLDTTP